MDTRPRRLVLFLASALAVALAACTLLLDRSNTQCATNGDCAHFNASAVCVAGFCQLSGALSDAGVDAPSKGGEGGEGRADGGSDAPSCPPGCFSGTPTTDVEFFNACTNSSCVVFDNCKRLGLCDGAAPALIAPPVPEAGAVSEASVPAVPCYSASRPTALYMQGSTNFTPFIAAMSKLVPGNTIIWQPTSSCAGAGAGGFATSTAMTNPTTSSQNPATFYDQNGNATACALGNGLVNDPRAMDANSDPTDIGESDVFSESCNPSWTPGTAPYPSIGEYLGPVQSFVFVTPSASDQKVISAEAARLVFGLGGDNGKSAPWTNPSLMLIRAPSTGTDIILSLAMGMPATGWWGNVVANATAMTNDIIDTSASSAEGTIGILSTDFADNQMYKTAINTLYFQATGQRAGFLPDSLPSTNDKQNTRDGHYAPWGYIHLYLTLASSQPQPQAKAFVSLFNEPNQALVDATILGGDVPVCAMHVTRTTEMGPLAAYAPAFQCNCYYDKSVNGSTACIPCTGPSDCPTQACNLGYCEAN